MELGIQIPMWETKIQILLQPTYSSAAIIIILLKIIVRLRVEEVAGLTNIEPSGTDFHLDHIFLIILLFIVRLFLGVLIFG